MVQQVLMKKPDAPPPPEPKPNLSPVKIGFSFLKNSLKIPMLVTSYQTPTLPWLNPPFFVAYTL